MVLESDGYGVREKWTCALSVPCSVLQEFYTCYRVVVLASEGFGVRE
jgi:hypothetical protein